MVRYRAQRLQNTDGSLSATLLGPNGVVEAAESYLHFLQDLGRSWHTVRAYASDLALFFDFLEQTGVMWQQVGMQHVAAFSAHLRSTNRARPDANVVLLRPASPVRAPASTQRTLTAVFGFYDFHSDSPLADAMARSRQQRTKVRGGAVRDPRSTVAVRVPATIKASLSSDELAKVLTAPPRLRDRLLLAVMGLNGLRVGAALGLRHGDISVRKGQLTVVPRDHNSNHARAKRHSPLVLPLHESVGRLYTWYLDEEYGSWDSDYVFINLWSGHKGAPVTYDAVRALIARTSQATGIPFTAHVLRHTFATLLRRGGADLESVSELLGHATVDITRQTYIHTTVEDLRRSLDQLEVQAVIIR